MYFQIKKACAEAMMFDNKQLLYEMINVIINLDAISDPVMPNVKAFLVVVGILTEQVPNIRT